MNFGVLVYSGVAVLDGYWSFSNFRSGDWAAGILDAAICLLFVKWAEDERRE